MANVFPRRGLAPALSDETDLIVDEGNLDWTEHDHGDHEFHRTQLAAATTAEELCRSLHGVQVESRPGSGTITGATRR
ncbi:hypothetical protein OB920_02050 [Halobacteria archaeon HArc-gm2]|nr:hypothetical protein [Halobacteria archaeon HArc-gm2]